MNANIRRTVSLVLIGTIILLTIVLGYPDALHLFNRTTDAADPGIPRSFAGNRLAYAFALFSLFSPSSLAIRKLWLMAAQLRDEGWRSDPDVGMYRLSTMAFLVAIVFVAAPDVLLMFLWGEVSAPAETTVMTITRIFDGLTVIPFVIGIILHVRAEQFQRTPSMGFFAGLRDEQPAPRERKLFAVVSRRETIAENVKIIIAVMVIAAGLALWK